MIIQSIKHFVLALLLTHSLSLGAQKQVHGLILDEANDEAMIFVNIAVVGSTYGTVSNQNGEFTINLEKVQQADSIAFYYLGYDPVKLSIKSLMDGMIVRMKEKPLRLGGITIFANTMSPEEILRKAIERKDQNYPVVPTKREVFTRYNRASYINAFDLDLKKSNITEVDQKLAQDIVDSIPRYNRSYEDYLYNLYTIPTDSSKRKDKVVGIKNVVLKEDDGGELDQIESVLNELFVNKTDDDTFWKYRTGPISFKEKNVNVSTSTPDSVKLANQKNDPLYLKDIFRLYYFPGDLGWFWDFIKRPNRYRFINEGITIIGGEHVYALSFSGRARGDYQGMIHIGTESFAILRIEYSIKEKKQDNELKLLGINYAEEQDDGLVLFDKDKQGYYLKYSMKANTTKYGVNRSFDIIRKQKRAIFNKKINQVDLHMNLQGRQESTNEVLVVSREGFTETAFLKIRERGARPEKITSYSESIWDGYSIIEPTKQMKEYQAKIKN